MRKSNKIEAKDLVVGDVLIDGMRIVELSGKEGFSLAFLAVQSDGRAIGLSLKPNEKVSLRKAR